MKHSISTWNIYERNEKFTPFSFFLLGEAYQRDKETREAIIPAIPFTKEIQSAPYASFYDYHSGKHYDRKRVETSAYWLNLKDFVRDYIDHKEGKLNGNEGTLERKKVEIIGIRQIVKESDNIEEAEAVGADVIEFKNYREKILSLTKESAIRIGFNINELYQLRKRLDQFEKSGKRLLLLTKKTKRKLDKLDSLV